MGIVQLVESEFVLCTDVMNGEYKTYGESNSASIVDRNASLLSSPVRLCNSSKNKYDSQETQTINLDRRK
jgi:hypothetical protein